MLSNLQQMHVKQLQKIYSKNIRSNWSLTGNKIANKITKVSQNSLENNSGTVTNEAENIGLDREILRGRLIYKAII